METADGGSSRGVRMWRAEALAQAGFILKIDPGQV